MNDRSKTSCRWSGALPGLLLLLVAQDALPARAEAATRVAGEASKHPSHRARRSGLEERVAILTRALGLDARQQRTLREVLVEDREQEQRIWSDASLPSAQRIARTKASSRQAADRIRAMLTAEQRKRYDPPSQDGPPPAVANAHVEAWTHP